MLENSENKGSNISNIPFKGSWEDDFPLPSREPKFRLFFARKEKPPFPDPKGFSVSNFFKFSHVVRMFLF